MWKYVCVIIVMLGSFYGGFKYSQAPLLPEPKTETEAFYKTKYEKLKSQMEQIHSVDFEEYMNLKEQKDKYLKADEILGKIFLMFLAEAGLKLSQRDLQFVKQATSGVPSVTPDKPLDVGGDLREAKKPLAALAPAPEWMKFEKNLKAVSNPKDNEDQLKNVEIKDLFSALKNAKPAGMDMAQKISGNYDGVVTLEKDQETWIMELELEVHSMGPKGEIEGSHKMTFAEPGKDPFSTSNGGWESDGFLVPEGGDSQALFMKVRAKGRQGYMQLYFVDGQRKLVGNYYEPVSLDKFNRAGTVILNKK